MPDYEIWAEKLCHVYVAHPVRPTGPPSEPAHMAVWARGTTAVRLVASGKNYIDDIFIEGDIRAAAPPALGDPAPQSNPEVTAICR